MEFFITGYKGLETVLFHEIKQILENTEATVSKQYGGIKVLGSLDAAYRVILYSRSANRVFHPLKTFKLDSEQSLYDEVKAIEWDDHLDIDKTFAISSSLSRSVLTHSQYAALKVKDALVDYFNEKYSQRPSVDKNRPDIRLHLNVRKQTAELSLDLSGESLHRRGYRLEHSGAPLKEHLAAALLLQAGWMKSDFDEMLDPMCGSGTFVIEAAMMKANIPPALIREHFGFVGWKQHEETVWQAIYDEAESNIDVSLIPKMTGFDKDHKAVSISRQNAERAGLGDFCDFKVQSMYQLEPSDSNQFIVFNPPYDERLTAEEGLANLYSQMGKIIKTQTNSDCFILSGNPDLLHRLRLTRISKKPLKNGPLNCVFVEIDLKNESKELDEVPSPQQIYGQKKGSEEIAEPLINRINKNLKHLKRWAKREKISCYRVYDADLPEFAFALDYYQSADDASNYWYHLQEYQAPKSVPIEKAEQRIQIAAEAIKQLFLLTDEQLVLKVRKKQKGTEQYEKHNELNEFHVVKEGHAELLINLTDYLDTGLFLDHRLTRQWVYKQSNHKRVLNLFCYTASVSVHAALGGADEVVSVDMSQTYLKWAKENLRLNDCGNTEQYPVIRADCMEFIKQPVKYDIKLASFDLIFLDPPSFSNSKKMAFSLDVQRDHQGMIKYAMKLLADSGQMLFSTNKKGFKIAPEISETYDVKDITAQTVAEDFKRKPKFHQCWIIQRY